MLRNERDRWGLLQVMDGEQEMTNMGEINVEVAVKVDCSSPQSKRRVTSKELELDNPTSQSDSATTAGHEDGEDDRRQQSNVVASTAAIRERRWSVSVSSVIAAIPALLLGITLGYPSNAILDLTGEATELPREYLLSSLMRSVFVAMAPVGAIFGGPIGGWIIDRWGRKCGMMFCGVPYLIGYLLLSYAHYVSTALVFNVLLSGGRFFSGIGMGWASAVSPVYTAELCSAKLRGIFGNMFPIFLTSGILLTFGLGAINGFRYYYVSLVAVGIVALFEILMIWLPETPRWLLSRRYGEEAEKVLLWLRGEKFGIKEELDVMKKSLSQNRPKVWKSFLKRGTVIPVIYILIIFTVQQGSGVNGITPFAGTLFSDAGVNDPRTIAIYAVGLSGIVGMVISVVAVDLFGRKVLLVVGGTGTFLGTALLGVHFFITDPDHTHCSDSETVCNPQYQLLSVFSVIVFNLSFNIGYNSVPFVLLSELLPLHVRGVVSGLATADGWAVAALYTGFYFQFSELVMPYVALWMIAGVNMAAVLFFILLLPETKGKSLEEMENKFVRRPNIVETVL